MIERHAIFERTPIVERHAIFKRTPIVHRIPITDTFSKSSRFRSLTDAEQDEVMRLYTVSMSRAKQRLDYLYKRSKLRMTKDEKECFTEFVPYYENCIKKLLKVDDYLLVPQDTPKSSPKWTTIYKAYCICKSNKWDYRIFLDANFESYHFWTDEAKEFMRFPMPFTLVTDRAKNCYKNYLWERQESYAEQGFGFIKVKPQSSGSITQDIENNIEKACRLLSNNVKYASSSYKYVFAEVSKEYSMWVVQKTYSLKGMWDMLPEEYVATIPHVLDYLEELKDQFDYIQEKYDVISMLIKSSNYRFMCRMAHKYEAQYNLPTQTIDLRKIDRIICPSV